MSGRRPHECTWKRVPRKSLRGRSQRPITGAARLGRVCVESKTYDHRYVTARYPVDQTARLPHPYPLCGHGRSSTRRACSSHVKRQRIRTVRHGSRVAPINRARNCSITRRDRQAIWRQSDCGGNEAKPAFGLTRCLPGGSCSCALFLRGRVDRRGSAC